MEKDKAQRLQQLKKDNTVNLDGLTSEMKSFVLDLDRSLQEKYPQGGYNLVVTSGARESSPGGKDSHHHSGNAVDLRADVTVYDHLYNSVEGLELLNKYGLGLLDETTKEILDKTKGTAPHLHIDKDPNRAKTASQRYAKAKDTADFFDKGGFKPLGLYNEMQISPEAKAKAEAQTGGANYSVASSYRTHRGATTPQGDGFIRDVEKEKDKEEKEKTDENRKEIEREKKEKEKEKEAQQNFFSEMTKEQPFLEEGKMRQEEPEMRQSRAPQIDIQSSLPNLPNIWQEFDFSQQEPIEFQGGGHSDTIIYPPGDSEYMNQPPLNYDIIEMLNRKYRREYEQYLKEQSDPTNINNTSPSYQQKFMMNQGLIKAEVGGIFGNIEVDPMGMYNGKRPVIIPSNSGENTVNITMEGVDFPVLGVSDEGDTKVMQPGKKYKFKGKNVLEIPLK